MLSNALAAAQVLLGAVAVALMIYLARRRGSLPGMPLDVYIAETQLTNEPLDVVYPLCLDGAPCIAPAAVQIRNPSTVSINRIGVTLIISEALGHFLNPARPDKPTVRLEVAHGLTPDTAFAVNKSGPYYYLHTYVPVLHPGAAFQINIPLALTAQTRRRIGVPVTFKDGSGTAAFEVDVALLLAVTVMADDQRGKSYNVRVQAFHAPDPTGLLKAWAWVYHHDWRKLSRFKRLIAIAFRLSEWRHNAILVFPKYESITFRRSKRAEPERHWQAVPDSHKYYRARWINDQGYLQEFKKFGLEQPSIGKD